MTRNIDDIPESIADTSAGATDLTDFDWRSPVGLSRLGFVLAYPVFALQAVCGFACVIVRHVLYPTLAGVDDILYYTGEYIQKWPCHVMGVDFVEWRTKSLVSLSLSSA